MRAAEACCQTVGKWKIQKEEGVTDKIRSWRRSSVLEGKVSEMRRVGSDRGGVMRMPFDGLYV